MALTEKYVSSLAAGGGTGNSEGSPYTLTEAIAVINGGSAAGMRFNIKADGTYTRSSGDTISGSGTVTAPVILRGYKTVIGDGYLGRTNGNGLLITTNMPLIDYNGNYYLQIAGAYTIIDSLYIRMPSSSTGYVIRINVRDILINCKIENLGNNADSCCWAFERCQVINNDFISSGTTISSLLYLFVGYFIVVHGNIFKCNNTNLTKGLINQNQSEVISSNNIFFSSPSYAIYINNTYPGLIINNTFYSQAAGIIRYPNEASINYICNINNIFVDSARAFYNPYNATAAHPLIDINNYRRNNTSADLGFGDWPSYFPVTATGGPSTDFVDAPNGDFRLISSSPAAGTGLPAYSDIGALQRERVLKTLGLKLK